MKNQLKENFVSRLGFLMVVAACAIGLGNVWRFPYVAGQSGGAIFVLIYLFFLIALGIPVMVVELSIGRAAKCPPLGAYTQLTPTKKNWGLLGIMSFVGCIILMSFYSVLTGWILYYLGHIIQGDFTGLTQTQLQTKFVNFLNNPTDQIWSALAVIFISCLVCYKGLRNGVEKITKPAMIGLFIIIIVLVYKCLSLDKASIGLEFYLSPNFDNLKHVGIIKTISNAMNQAFFTLSLGIGAVLAIGACTDGKHSLLKESIIVAGMDTLAAIASGLIIFPACFSYGITPDAGPTLIFNTLLSMFNQMEHGIIWGSLFFFFIFLAAILTMIAVIESIVATISQLFNKSRGFASICTFAIVFASCIPVILGFNVWSSFEPLGKGSNILDLADFIVSNNMLPIGAFLMVMYCSARYGWGWNNFITEACTGDGIKLKPNTLTKLYFKYVLPTMVLLVMLAGYYEKFFS